MSQRPPPPLSQRQQLNSPLERRGRDADASTFPTDNLFHPPSDPRPHPPPDQLHPQREEEHGRDRGDEPAGDLETVHQTRKVHFHPPLLLNGDHQRSSRHLLLAT